MNSKTLPPGQQFFAMKTKRKLYALLLPGYLAMTLVSCSFGNVKPASGFDVSLLSPRLLSISPRISDGSETPAAPGQAAGQTNPDGEIPPAGPASQETPPAR